MLPAKSIHYVDNNNNNSYCYYYSLVIVMMISMETDDLDAYQEIAFAHTTKNWTLFLLHIFVGNLGHFILDSLFSNSLLHRKLIIIMNMNESFSIYSHSL